MEQLYASSNESNIGKTFSLPGRLFVFVITPELCNPLNEII
jgi:hypothetical protein